MKQALEPAPVNLNEFEPLACTRMPSLAYDYYRGGACDEVTLRENSDAYSRIRLRPRMLVDISQRSMSTTLLGSSVSMPILVAPMAFQRMAHPEGELATVRAASTRNTVMIVSTLANTTVEDVAAAGSGNCWFQLYVYKDRELTRSLVQRAEEAGCKALVVTVDSPLLGRREKDVRNRFALPQGLVAANLARAKLEHLPNIEDESGLAHYIANLYDTSLTWKALEWFKSITKLPVLIKGVLRADDAQSAIKHGADGIVVSNHGGRQLDTTIATITALPEVAAAARKLAGEDYPILLDGGIRRGTDVLKALALGANAVLLGRPILWGLALDGQSGVERILEMLRSEFDLSMALAGCSSLSDITPDLIYQVRS